MTIEAGHWRGRQLSELLSMWFDQLATLEPLATSEHAAGCYIDVQLTATMGGGSATSPQITFKAAVENGHGRPRR